MRKVNFYIVFAIVIVLAFSIYYFLETPSNEDLAKCLTKNGAVMYGTSWCGHCKTQKDLFGASFKYITYVDCELKEDICKQEGIVSYPTWKFKEDNVTKEGAQTLSSLSKLANC